MIESLVCLVLGKLEVGHEDIDEVLDQFKHKVEESYLVRVS